ncbi:Lrp/AsnC family transcriptional regulator [Halomonas cupida]|uniref:AsnC family transcriptional regulator n=1 Tax=Halomonas cupida TaxID=44933 RepID=A0A1M7CP42_9GAMM|nr:Lrp/AsnC family transcriptional regulator [Halomonas cupida]GEN26045.1 AsnC family transcriptional regulator [Halomonas cupida]SHL69036.1 Lrp/AsnC family transcriptional regulator, leucine-responsive regulatory protein [Halomonas cupida]
MKTLRYKNYGLDEIDETILTILVENGRTTTAELARKVNLSSPSVAERVRRMEDAGVITGYSASISPEAIGLPIAVWLRVRPVPGEMQRVAEILKGIPEITQCDRVTGEDCFLARAHLASIADMERVIDQIVPYAMTNTSIIQSSPVEKRLPPLPGTSRQ